MRITEANIKARQRPRGHWTALALLGAMLLCPAVLMAQTPVFPAETLVNPEDDGLVREGLAGRASAGAGVALLGNDSFKFGEYTGLSEEFTPFAYGDMAINYNKGNFYLDVYGENLGWDNRNVYIEGGSYGNFSLYGEFDQSPHLTSNSSRSFLNGIGTNTLTLPTGFVTSISTGGMTITGVKDVNLEVDRRSVSLGGSKTFDNFKFNLDFNRDEKSGLGSLGMVFGPAWFRAGTTILPEAIDQITHEGTATLAYNGKYGQTQLQYFFSDFNNRRESISLENPFLSSGQFPAATGLISRDPDNQHHQISLSGGLSLLHNTRVSFMAEYGMMRQDENLLPFAVGTDVGLLPRQTADAVIYNSHVSFSISTEATDNLYLAAKFKYYQTVNDTAQDLFLKFANDELGTQAALTSDDALFNLPYDYIQNQFNLSAAYAISSDTLFRLDYEAESFERDFRAVSETREHSAKARLKSTHFEHAHFNIFGSYSMLDGGDYDSNSVFIARHLFSVIGLNGAQFEVNPALRRFDVADRDRLKYGASIALLPGYFISMDLNGQFQDDDYFNSPLGLQESKNRSLTVDINYFGLLESLHAYYTYDESDYRQKGRQFSSAADSLLAASDWQVSHKEKTHTIGVGGYIGFWNDDLTFRADYTYAYSMTDINFLAGATVGGLTTSLPQLQTRRHTLKFDGVWKYDDHTDFGFKYIVEKYQSDDWGTDGFTPSSDSIGQALLLTGSPRDYLGHIGVLYGTIHFGGRK